jgi:MSHA type pilus biogenesis protein MshL
MRLITLISLLAISLCTPSLLLAQSQQQKTKILIEEWKQVEKPQVTAVSENKAAEETVKPKPEIPKLQLPEVFDKKITLRSQGVSLKAVVSKIGEITGYNVVYDPEVDSNVNVSLDTQDVPVWRALNTLFFPLNYGFKVKDKDLVILAKETRTFKLTLPPNTQTFSDTISNESWTRSDDTTTSASNNNANNNSNMSVKVGARVFVESKEDALSFWKDVELNLSKMVSASGKYSFNKLAGLVMVTDSPQVLDKIANYIDLANTETNKQILVEVKILEVTLSRENTFGIDWNAIYKNLGDIKQLSLSSNFAAQSITSSGLFTLTATGPKDDSGTGSSGISALIKGLQSQGRVEVISQPKIMLLNNHAAMVQVGTVTSYVANTTTTTTSVGLASTSATTDQVQEGVSLRLMASILDDQILVQLTPVVTTLDQIRSIDMGQGTTIEAPKTSTKSMHTLVKIKDGQTIAVGGLITSNDNNTEKGIPLLRDLPLIGKFFEYKSKTHTRTELVIFITPKILPR